MRFVNKFGNALPAKLRPDEVLSGVTGSDIIAEKCHRATGVPRKDCARILEQVGDELAYDLEQLAKELDRSKPYTKKQMGLPGYLGYMVLKVSNPGSKRLTISLDPSWRLLFIVNAVRLGISWAKMARPLKQQMMEGFFNKRRPKRDTV